AKAAGVNIAQNKIYSFKDFILELIPEGVKGADSDLAYFTVDGTGYAYTGVETARTIESEDFDGKALQGLGRAGEFIPEDNKKAV
ncbi:phage capsid protein, partial [Enterococcus faecalis]